MFSCFEQPDLLSKFSTGRSPTLGIALMPLYCEVALPVPLDRTFTYAVRDGQRPLRGARVIVPFRNEKLIGIVLSVGTVAPADFEARYIEALLDQEGPGNGG